jgi:hypothetical protein
MAVRREDGQIVACVIGVPPMCANGRKRRRKKAYGCAASVWRLDHGVNSNVL